jgi:uncharacterized protein RhaS with RHS repeats
MMYSPTLGRFISNDPIGFQGGDMNLYRFVENNPANATDPSGLFPIRWLIENYINNPTQVYQEGPAPSVWIRFDPTKSTLVSKPCDRIVFVQALKLFIDGKPVGPRVFHGVNALGKVNSPDLDKLMTADGWRLDGASTTSTAPWMTPDQEYYLNGLWQVPSGYYGCGSRPAITADAPGLNDNDRYRKKKDGPGIRDIRMEFYTFAFCASGADCGSFYEGVHWEHTASWDNPQGKYTILATNLKTPPPEFFAAYNHFLSVQGIKHCGWKQTGPGPVTFGRWTQYK